MRQSQHPVPQSSNAEADIIHHFRSSGEKFAAEAAVLDAAIRGIVIDGRKVTNKAIMIYLITELETTSDPHQQNILRSALEVIVNRSTGSDVS